MTGYLLEGIAEDFSGVHLDDIFPGMSRGFRV